MAGSLMGATATLVHWRGDEVKKLTTEKLAYVLGSTAWEAQEKAKEMVAVLTGRLRGSITCIVPGENPMISQNENPVEQGVSRDDAIAIAQGLVIAVGAFTPYAAVEEFTRSPYLAPAMDYAAGTVQQYVDEARGIYGD